jgi:hypothetical protein
MAGQAQAYYADGTPIPASELAAAVAGGKAHFERDAQVLVRDAEGRAGTVSGADVGALLAAGGGLETEETLGAEQAQKERQAKRGEALDRALNPLEFYKGYQEAIARGATLGLSDVALTEGLGDEYREGALARAQNPAMAIPELGGAAGAAVAGSLLGGAPGALGGAARVTAAGGRLLGAAGGVGEALGAGAARTIGLGARGQGALGLLGRGAAEGALAGTGQEVSAAALEDRDLTVDKLMAAAGHGALAGGVLNVAVGGGSKLIGAAGRAALDGMGSGKGLGESLASFAERRAFKDVTGNAVKHYNEASNFGKNPERIERIGRKLLDDGVTGKDPLQAWNISREKLEETGQRLRSIADQLDASGARVDPATILSRVDERIAKLRSSELPDFDSIANNIERKVKKLRARANEGGDYSFTEAWQLRRDIDKIVKHAKQNRTLAEEEVSALRGIIDDALDRSADGLPAKVRGTELANTFGQVVRGELDELRWDVPFRGQFRDTNALRSAFEGATDVNAIATGRALPPGSRTPLPPVKVVIEPGQVSLRDGRHRMAVARDFGATEIGAEISVYDAAGDLISRTTRPIAMPGVPRADAGLQASWLKAKEDFSDYRIVRDALQALNIRNEKNRFTSPSDYFSGGMAFLSAVMSGGSALAGLATAAATGAIHKQLREKGPGAIARIADRISKLDKRTDKAIAAAIEGKPKDLPDLPKRTAPLLTVLDMPEGPPLRTAAAERDRYERTLKLVRDLGSDTPSPEAAKRLGNATASLAEDFPELASLLQQRVIAAARALNARAPVPLQRRNALQPQLEDMRIPAGMISKWLREVDAADAPESIWHDMARGRVPREKIEIVKLTAPHLFEDWRARVMKYVAAKPDKLSRPQRIRLSLAFDFTGDATLDPAFISQVQGEYAAEREAEQQAPASPQPTNLSSASADDMKPPTEQSFLQAG